MTTTNDKPAQTPIAPNGTKQNQPNTGTPQERTPATGENDANKAIDPTTPDTTKRQPTDPNNPQATNDAPAKPAIDKPKEHEKA